MMLRIRLRYLFVVACSSSFLVWNNQAFLLLRQTTTTTTMSLLPTTTTTTTQRQLSATAAAAASTRPAVPPPTTPPPPHDDDDDDTDNNNNHHAVRMGRVIDILHKDYSADVFLRKSPDFSIYDSALQCVGPDGSVKWTGLGNYKAAFAILHAIVPLVYTDTTMQHKIIVDAFHNNNNNTIRIHWHMQATPRFQSASTQQHTLDGISVYHVSPTTGNVTQHTIERLLWQPPAATTQLWQQLFSLQRQQQQRTVEAGVAVPNCAKETAAAASTPLVPMLVQPHQVVQFQSSPWWWWNPVVASSQQQQQRSTTSALFSGASDGVEPGGAQQQQQNVVVFDAEALASRNKSRQKFGLKPLSPQEFMDLQQQIMRQQQQQQAAKELAATVAPPQQQQSQKKQQRSFLDKMRGALGADKLLDKNTCESNFDCERPMVCCDFGFLVKRCCSTGAMVGPNTAQQHPYGKLVPVPADSGYEKRPRQFPPSW